MSNILFIEKKMETEKLGMMYLSAYLKERGHNTELVQTDEEDIFEAIERFKPNVFAYSTCTGEHRHALKTNEKIKKRYPKILSVFGGAHPTFFPEIANEKDVDFVVIGQGEEAMIEIIEGKTKQKIIKKPLMENLNSLPIPDREILYKYDAFRNNPMKNVITQRDCPYDCTYCHNHLNRELFKDEKHKMFQRKTVDYTIKEIENIKKNYPLERILFIDDSFLGNRKWLDEFCKKYKEKINLPFICCVRANLVKEDLVVKLKNAGLSRVHFSIESASPYVQKEILNRGQITNQDIEESIMFFKKYNIMIRLQQMIGLPIENPLEDALNTLKFSLKNKPDESWVTIYQPYPKTKLGEYCLEHGFAKGNLEDYCGDNYFNESRLDIPDKDKIQRLQRWWHFITKYNLPVEFIQVLLEIPLDNGSMEKMAELRIKDYKTQFLKIK